MDRDKVAMLAELLPEHLIIDAAGRYIQELANAGEIEEARNLYTAISAIDSFSACLPQAALTLIRISIQKKMLEDAIRLYEHFPQGQSGDAYMTEKLKASHLLIHALMGIRFEQAFAIWADLRDCLQNQAHKWHWAQSGLALLKYCHKNSSLDMAQEIHRLLQEYAQCEITESIISRAEHILKKIYKWEK